MRQKLIGMVAAVALVAVMSVQAAFGQAAQKTWKDGEYDLANPALSDQNAATRLGKLDAWKAKFPTTDFVAERQQTYLVTYQALKKPAEVYSAAKEILARDPQNLAALTALVYQPAPTPADVPTAEAAANTLLTNGDKIFGPDNKPKGVTDDQWAAAKKEIQTQAQTSLATGAFQRGEWEKAEAEYQKLLTMQPNNTQASYQLATAYVKDVGKDQAKVAKLQFAIFHLARASNLTGPGVTLDDKARASIKTYFEKQYSNYHGDKTDMDKVVALALASPLPPADFHIKSLVEIAEEKQKKADEDAKNDPAGAMWKTIRETLLADGGQAYFDGSIKGAALPGGANGVNKFKGKLVSMTPALNPKELVLGITDGAVGEVTLKLDGPLRGKMDVGTEIGFEGVANAFTKDPFMVTFDVEKAKITGWVAAPAPVRPPARKK